MGRQKSASENAGWKDYKRPEFNLASSSSDASAQSDDSKRQMYWQQDYWVHVFDTLKPLVANYIDSSVASERMHIKSGYNQLIFIAKARVGHVWIGKFPHNFPMISWRFWCISMFWLDPHHPSATSSSASFWSWSRRRRAWRFLVESMDWEFGWWMGQWMGLKSGRPWEFPWEFWWILVEDGTSWNFLIYFYAHAAHALPDIPSLKSLPWGYPSILTPDDFKCHQGTAPAYLR